MPAVDPVVTAAWITSVVGALGITGTVTATVVGSRNTRKATERTVEAGADANRATLVAAREDKLWERRAAAYEETLTRLLHRQAQRHFDLRKYRTDGEAERMLKEFYENYELPGMFETEARLVAYASDAVMEAHKVTRGAHATVKVAYSHRAALRESAKLAQESGRLEGVPDADTMMDADRQLDRALTAADAADDALIQVIRDELRSRPEAVTLPAALPVEHHRFLRRTS